MYRNFVYAALLLALLAGTAGCGGATPTAAPAQPVPATAAACLESEPTCVAPATANPAPTGAPAAETAAPAEVAQAPAETGADSPETGENGEYVQIEWGQEATFDEMLELGKRGEIAVLEWYALTNAVRLVMADGQYLHVKNEKWGRSVKKEFDKLGVKTGKGGIPLNYYFCN